MKSKIAMLLLSSFLLLSVSYSQDQWTSNTNGGQNNLSNVKKLSVFVAGTTGGVSGENRLKYSEELNSDAWFKQNIGVNDEAAMDGAFNNTMEMINCIYPYSAFIFQTLNVRPGQTYRFSWDVKRGTSTKFMYGVYNSTAYNFITSPTDYYNQTSSSVQRVSITFTTPPGCVEVKVFPFSYTTDTAAAAQPSTGTLYLGRMQVDSTGTASYVTTAGDPIIGSGGASTPAKYALFTDDSAKVGIGNNAPTQKLDVTGNIKFSGVLIAGSNAGTEGQVLTSAGPNAVPTWATQTGGGGTSQWVTTGTTINYGNGNVGINTNDTKGYKFAVNGEAIFNRAVVKQYAAWPDFVFQKEYKLPSLKSLEAFINANKHLPNIPSAAEVEKNGIDLGSNQAALLQKIEELTLYIIEQNKKQEEQNKQLEQLQKQLNEQNKKIEAVATPQNKKPKQPLQKEY
jgi:hypothetical protein